MLQGTLYSCQKDEEVNKLDADYRVMTDYDPETDFSQFRSYYLADNILFIGQIKILQYLDKSWTPVTITCRNGVTVALNKEKADLGLHQYLPFCGIHRFTLLVAGIFSYWVLLLGRTEFGGRNQLVGGKFKTYTNTQRNTRAAENQEFGKHGYPVVTQQGEVLRLKMGNH